MKWGLLTLVVILILIAFPFGKELPPPPIPNPIEPSTPAQPLRRTEKPGSKAHFSSSYNYAVIDKNIQSSRFHFSRCFLLNKTNHNAQVQLSMTWEGSGAFRGLVLKPDLGQEVSSCLAEIIQAWALPKHPGLKPFSYSRVLELAQP